MYLHPGLMNRKTASLTLLIGLLAGIAAGLAFGWLVWPVSYNAVTPAVLQTRYRQDYVVLIAEQYVQDGDLAQAQQQLARLGSDWQTLLTTTAATSPQSTVSRLAADLGLTGDLPTPTPAAGAPDG